MVVIYVLLAVLITLPVATLAYYSKKNLPGIVLCFSLAAAAHVLGRFVPLAGGAVVAIVLGIALANFWHYPAVFKPGISATSKRMLQSAIVLLGFQMNLWHVVALGSRGLLLIFAVIITAVAVAYWVGKALHIQQNEQIMIGVGTAICGGSAIAAVAPVIKADEQEIATAISTVFLFNVLAVFIFPFAGHLLSMGHERFGFWAGAGINDMSSVVAAAYSMSREAGDTAMVVKLTRALMILPVSFIVALMQSKKAKSGGFSLLKIFPWFVVAFFAASIVNSFDIIPVHVSALWGSMGKFFIVAAMGAIGLNTNLRGLIRHGSKPILLGGCCSLAVIVVSLLILSLTGLVSN
ncbi:MAG: YeiH family protein [Treponema sp.]|nr:YeiH family protein [Treponema sp.]